MKKIIIILLLSMVCVASDAQFKRESRMAYLHYLDKNYSESFKEYTQLLKYNDLDHIAILAQHYNYGLGTEANKAKAIEYYTIAANRGDRMSQQKLCVYNFDDESIEDLQQQKDLYKYSRMYCTNFEFDDTGNSSDNMARYALYLCYKNGWGTPKNAILADMWLAYAAFNGSTDAEDTFCEIYNINEDDYNSEAEEFAFYCTFFKHAYKIISEYIKDDHSVEADYFRMYYNMISGTPSLAALSIKQLVQLYENKDVPKAGKATLYNYLTGFFPYYKDLRDKYKQDAEKYELVSEESKNTWHYTQFTKVLWKVDTKLNKSYSPTGKADKHEWVDLGLPSGRKWSTCNIGSAKPSQAGTFFAWSELDGKSMFSKSNFKGDKNQINLDLSHDAAQKHYGKSWMVPSIEDWRELFSYCDIIFDSNSRCIVAKSPNGQSVMLPLIDNSEQDGYTYWTNTNITTLFDQKEYSAISLKINSSPDWGFVYSDSWIGCQIRPVVK